MMDHIVQLQSHIISVRALPGDITALIINCCTRLYLFGDIFLDAKLYRESIIVFALCISNCQSIGEDWSQKVIVHSMLKTICCYEGLNDYQSARNTVTKLKAYCMEHKLRTTDEYRTSISQLDFKYEIYVAQDEQSEGDKSKKAATKAPLDITQLLTMQEGSIGTKISLIAYALHDNERSLLFHNPLDNSPKSTKINQTFSYLRTAVTPYLKLFAKHLGVSTEELPATLFSQSAKPQSPSANKQKRDKSAPEPTLTNIGIVSCTRNKRELFFLLFIDFTTHK